MKKHIKNALLAGTTIAYLYRHRGKLAKALAFALPTLSLSTPALAQMSEAVVSSYANAMQTAANNQNVGQIARLLADDVVISLSRQGRGTATLDKSGYLDLLQKSWTQSRNYRYQLSIDNVVITGDTARVQMVSKETFSKDGKNTTLTTSSRATLGMDKGNALLLRSVSQVTVE